MGGGGGSSGPTVQQQQLQTQQALTTANLNLEENAQRKTILNSMQGTRVFRGSALSRALRGNNNNAPSVAPGPSTAQVNGYGQLVTASQTSLFDQRAAAGSNVQPGSPLAGGSSGIRGGTGGGSYKGGQLP